MVHLCVFDITDLSYAQLREMLPKEELFRLESKKSDAYRRASAAGRLAAAALFQAFFHRIAPPVVLSSNGAPSFLGEPCALSISHSDNLVAVALSDGESVGIDVESFAFIRTHSPERQTTVSERLRLPSDLSVEGLPPYRTVTLNAHGAILSDDETSAFFAPSAPLFLERYTALEAVMKADGRGFSALTDANMLFQKYNIYSGIIHDKKGDSYVLSLAY